MNMNANIKYLINFWIVGLILFYGLPLFAKLIPSSYGLLFFIITLVILNPVYSFISGLLYTIKKGFNWYLPLSLGILFIPAIYLFYNDSATMYAFAYTIISFVGSIIGFLIYRK